VVLGGLGERRGGEERMQRFEFFSQDLQKGISIVHWEEYLKKGV
jgi:hypothetical protein